MRWRICCGRACARSETDPAWPTFMGWTIAMVDDPKAKVMVELDPAAVLLLTDQTFQDGVEPWTPKHNALGPLRLAQTTSPDWSSDRGQVYRIFLRREQAQDLVSRCQDVAQILETFPDQEHRGYGKVLERAGRALAEGLRLTDSE